MIKKTHIVLLGIISLLFIVTIFGFLIKEVLADESGNSADIAENVDNSSIFESVSSLDALNLGIIDGDTLREENGIESNGDSDTSVAKDVSVSISLRSIQDDLKIKLSDVSTGNLIYNVNFTVTVKGKDKTENYSDTDKDGIIYLPYVSAGDYTVFMSDITSDGVLYHCDKSQTITVTDSIKYTKVDIKDEIKTEAEINVAEEDTKVQDVDQTTDLNSEQSAGEAASEASVEEEQIFDEGISEDAEDLLAQIEAETNAEENAKAIAGASSGTLTQPQTQPSSTPAADITTDPQYVASHAGSKGIDVSKHNGNIDWGAVKASGIDFAIIRCGYRGSSSGALVVDPLYYQNIIAAQGAGLNVGVYFFSQAVNEAEAVEEASMVLELISGYSLQMPVYIDVEKSNGRGDEISVEERTNVTAAFLATIRNAGYTAGLYSNKLWFENRINTGAFLDYKIWLAQYVDIPTYTATRYDMWQYTSKGSIPGISGNVDMNVLK